MLDQTLDEIRRKGLPQQVLQIVGSYGQEGATLANDIQFSELNLFICGFFPHNVANDSQQKFPARIYQIMPYVMYQPGRIG